MHTIADSWAHMFYIGIPAWFANNAGETVYRYEGDKKIPVAWKRVWPWDDSTDIFNGESASPNMFAYNSLVYLGHGRMGHLPDYPYYVYEYKPEWSENAIIKDNYTYFLKAIKQLTKALECIRTKTEFDINTYANLTDDVEKIIKEVLGTKNNDQCDAWKRNIGRIKIDGKPLEVPEEYNKNKWLDEVKACIERRMPIKMTSYYHFNKSATLQLKLVRNELEENNISIDSIPKERIVSTKFKCKKGKQVGTMHKGLQYYPKMNEVGITLDIIKPTPKLLTSGDIIEIRTRETSVGEYNFLGAWETPWLYYYTRYYDLSKQKWQIEKVDTSKDEKIRAGDEVRFRSMHFEKKPYLCTVDYIFGGTYLSTQSNSSSDKSIWIMENLTEFNMYIVTTDYFRSDIIDLNTSALIHNDIKEDGIIDSSGNVDKNILRKALDSISLGFLQVELNDEQKEQVLIQLRKLVNYSK
ncbi:MAG: hypothetical protein PVG39_06860 [Desulfobacteraceae bacterium]